MIRSLCLAAVLAAALAAPPALAASDEAPEAPTVTAPATPSVADQIDAYLRASPVRDLPAESDPTGVTGSAAPRQPHGEVALSVGSHGYRSAYARTDLPLGKTGMLSIAVQETRGGGRYGRWQGRNLGVGLALGVDGDAPCRRGPEAGLQNTCLGQLGVR